MAPNLRTSKGQALLESLLALPILTLGIGCLMSIVLWVWTSVWAQVYLYEALICTASIGGDRRTCAREYQEKFQAVLGLPADIQLSIQGKTVLRGELHMRLNSVRWTYKDKIHTRNVQ